LDIKSLGEVVKEIADLKGIISFWNAQVRLDEFLEVRGEASARRTEFIGEKILQPVTPQKPPPILALDGSSRIVGTAYAFTTIAAVSLVSERFGVILDYPHLWFKYPVLLEREPPFIGVAPEAPNIKLKLPPYATQRSPAGFLYDPDYNRSQIVDEVRTNLENKVLKDGAIKAALTEVFGLKHRLILVDGPLYHTPAVFMNPGIDEKYKLSWKVMIEDRIEAIRENLEHELTVVGIVKRFERSTIIIRSYEYLSRVNNVLGVDVSRAGSDLAAIDTIYHYAKKKGVVGYPLRPQIIGPFLIKPSWVYIDVPNAPSKVVAYVIIPKHPYLDVGYRVFRVEVPYEAYDKYENLVFEWIVGDTVYFSTTLPYSLILADTRCKKWSASLLLYISRLYSEAKIPLTYESRLMVEYVFKEMTSK